MAVQRNENQTTSTSNNANNNTSSNGNNYNNRPKKEALGYLNLKVKTASGEWITIPAYIPLNEDQAVHIGLMKKHEKDAEFEFEIKGTIGVKTNVIPEF